MAMVSADWHFVCMPSNRLIRVVMVPVGTFMNRHQFMQLPGSTGQRQQQDANREYGQTSVAKYPFLSVMRHDLRVDHMTRRSY